METVTQVVERDDKRASELKVGDWIAMWWIGEVLFVYPYPLRGKRKVRVEYRDPEYDQPEVHDFDADDRVSLADPDEIPTPYGRDVDAEVDLSVGVPPFVEGHFETGRS